MITATAMNKATKEAKSKEFRLDRAKYKVWSSMERARDRGVTNCQIQVPCDLADLVIEWLEEFGYYAAILPPAYIKHSPATILRISWKNPKLAKWEV